MSFEAVAFLLMPAADPGSGIMIEADGGWEFREPPPNHDAEVMVWGRAPWPVGTPVRTWASSALARERALRHLVRHPPAPFTRAVAHRWWLPRIRPGTVRNVVKATIYGGALLELARSARGPRVIDACVRAAGDSRGATNLRPVSGGSVIVTGTLATGGPALIRVAKIGAPSDPSREADALHRLGQARVQRVPRLRGRGREAGASWSAESLLPGRRPHRLTRGLATQIAGFCAALPRSGGPPTAHREDFSALAEDLPQLAAPLRELEEVTDSIASALPGVLRHGDLWVGNLLTEGGDLRGVIDWAAWHPEGVPGTDLVHLHATDLGFRMRKELGEVWLTRPWRSALFRQLTAGYWEALGLSPSREVLDAIGTAWWASRLPHVLFGAAKNPAWVARNVRSVLETALG